MRREPPKDPIEVQNRLCRAIEQHDFGLLRVPKQKDGSYKPWIGNCEYFLESDIKNAECPEFSSALAQEIGTYHGSDDNVRKSPATKYYFEVCVMQASSFKNELEETASFRQTWDIGYQVFADFEDEDKPSEKIAGGTLFYDHVQKIFIDPDVYKALAFRLTVIKNPELAEIHNQLKAELSEKQRRNLIAENRTSHNTYALSQNTWRP